jgi:hypothetical protein
MHPVSQDRVTWVRARLEVLTRMIEELRDRPAKYLRPGLDNASLTPGLQSMMVERVQLLVELEVLTEFFNSYKTAVEALATEVSNGR